MLRKILVLMIAGIIGISYVGLSWAESKESMEQDEENYLIGPGDVLNISVWKDESLTRLCVVRPDGFISFPLIGNIRAAGRTASKLKSEMEGRLTRYIPEVVLSLEIKEINSMIIYVIGRVNNPGRFILNTDVNVLQALATAGGLNVFAKRNNIKIFRHESEETTMYPFEYDQVIDGKRLEQNIYLRRGDVVVVP
jgi:polysaccharide export outer membrane protein